MTLDHSEPYRRLVMESPSELFHEASKLRESDTALGRAVWSVNASATIRRVIANPATSYPGFPMIQLPPASLEGSDSLTGALLSRQSVRSFSTLPLGIAQFSNVMFHAAAVTRRAVDADGIAWGFRSAPSGGALYPVDIYCVAMNVTELPAGIYAYEPKQHALQLVKTEAVQDRLRAATFLTETSSCAAAAIVMVANFPRSKFKYGERAYRFVLLEAGHIAQNILLTAAALRLGALPLGGFIDDAMNALLDVDGVNQAVVYAILVGHPDESR